MHMASLPPLFPQVHGIPAKPGPVDKELRMMKALDKWLTGACEDLSAALAQGAASAGASSSSAAKGLTGRRDAERAAGAQARADSAPPSCLLAPPGGANSNLRGHKKTYRAGRRVTAKRVKAASRTDLCATSPVPQAEAKPASANTSATAISQPPAAAIGPLEVREVRAARSDSAPPACRGLSEPKPASGGIERLYYKPRRRAGQRVRQRMEYAIARRRDMAAPTAEGDAKECGGGHGSDMEAAPSAVPKAPSTKPAAGVSRFSTGDAGGGAQEASPVEQQTTKLPQIHSRRQITVKAPSPQTSVSASPRDSVTSTAEIPDASNAPDSLIGQRVLIGGLVSSPQFNGKWGQVESFDPVMKRYVVRVFLPDVSSPVLAKLRRETLLVASIEQQQARGPLAPQAQVKEKEAGRMLPVVSTSKGRPEDGRSRRSPWQPSLRM